MASDKTWKRDLDEKPHVYAHIGVQEYYAFDPYEPPLPLSRRKGRRLFGWHLDTSIGLMRQVPPQPDGSLWSPQLNSWLRPEGMYLRLYDRSGRKRLTEKEVNKEQAETEALARQAEARRAEAATGWAEREAQARQAEAERAEAAIRQMQAETERAEREAERAEREALRAQEAIRQAQALAEKLRALGIDPEQPL
jgi:hypothetical protein